MLVTHKRNVIMFALGICLMLVSAAAMAQTPADAVADAVANSGVFPAGTTVVSVTYDDTSVVVDLSGEAITPNFGDALADDMVEAICGAVGVFEGITTIEVTVGGQPLWTYLPAATEQPAGSGTGTLSLNSAAPIGGFLAAQDPLLPPSVPSLSSELSGKLVVLHPSHGSYWHQGYSRWFRAMRTYCGPNASGGYQPSPYYYNTVGFKWGSFYEDDMSPETIRFLKAYCDAGGAACFVSRNLDKNAGEFDYNAYGYPNSSFPVPKWQTATKYYLQDRGDVPEWVWNEPALSAQTDKDLRARPYYANWLMQTLGYNKDNSVSFSLHSNAASFGGARGTETYWYTSMYPDLTNQAKAYCSAVEAGVISAIRNEYDGYWANPMYLPPPPARPEFTTGTYYGYIHNGGSTTRWQDRGVKTTNFGEIREAKMPAQLMELAFHDDWKFYPDHVFMMDRIWRATVAWGMYNGFCNYFGVTPRPIYGAEAVSADFPTLVGPNQVINGTVTMKNLGMAWCYGDKWVNMLYFAYTPWNLAATADDQFGAAGTKIAIANDGNYYPGDTADFAVTVTAPATTGLYTTAWRMLKDDLEGGSFGATATAEIQVDADPPVITITSPAAQDYPYGCVTVGFSAVDALSEVASLTADIDGTAVVDGQVVCNLALGAHTLTVTAVDTFGNSASQSVTFNIVNSVGTVTIGGWIELLDKKGTCGFNCQYAQGDPAPTGNLTYQDHDTGMTVHSIDMVAMGIVGNHAWFFGTCEVEGEAGHWFRVDVIDNGEPGSSDVFNISLDTGYSQGGLLGGGNVQVL